MNKNSFVLLTVLLIATLLWVFGFQEKTANKRQHANVVSLQTSDNQNKPPEPKKSTRKKEVVKADVVTYKEPVNYVSTPDEKNKSYLSTYRQLKLAEVCRRIYGLDGDNPDYETWLTKRMQSFRNDKNFMPPVKQLEQLDLMVSECLNLKESMLGIQVDEAIKAKDKQYGQTAEAVINAIQVQLDQIQPKTEKEKAIATALKDIEYWRQSLVDVLKTSQGEDTLTAEEIEAKQQQIEVLSSEMWRYVQDFSDSSNQTRFREIIAEIKEIDKSINNQKKVNVPLRANQLKVFNQATAQLLQHLSVRDADVFLEVMAALEFSGSPFNMSFNGIKGHASFNVSELLPEYISPTKAMMTELGVKGNTWLQVNGDHVNRLYYCQIGGACGPNDILARSMCLPLAFIPKTQACNLGTVFFMKNHLLSPNQWSDVQLIKEWLEAKYGS